MARNVYGLDLGTYDIKIFDKKKDRIWHAKNVIAMKDKKYIFSVGNYHLLISIPLKSPTFAPEKEKILFEGFKKACWFSFFRLYQIFSKES